MLACYDCGERVGVESPADAPARCACGEPLWFDAPDVSRWPRGRGVAAFADWLPVEPTEGVAAGAGGTPLVREPAIDADGARAYVKIEGTNPTGSFKDRGSAVGVTAAARAGRPVGTVSHGNMAVSMAAHAASAGIDCVVLVPADVSEARLARIARHRPTIYRVDGDYGRLYHDALAADTEAVFVNSDVPLRVAGQKTTTLELLRSFAVGRHGTDDAPDAIVCPVSSGGHASGAWKAIRDARRAGLLDAVPRLYFVQAAACDPIARADRAGAEAVERLGSGETEETIAYSIANRDPPSGTRTLRAARATGGRVVAVEESAIEAAHDRLARLGYRMEPSCATVLPAFERLRGAGEIAADEDVALVATGVGYGTGEAGGIEAPVVDRSELAGVLEGAW